MAGMKAIMKVSTIRVTPDTGATADLISKRLTNSLGCKIRSDHSEYKVTGVDKAELSILGTTTVRIRLPTGEWEKIMVVVVPKLSDSFLMSWHTQKVLGILPVGWPHKSFKIRKANVTICPKKLSSPSPSQPVEEQKVGPPPEWDPK